MNLLIVFFFFLLLEALPFNSDPHDKEALLNDLKPYDSIITKVFQTKDDLFESELWATLLKKKNPQLAQSTVIFINKTSSVYYFRASETQPSNKKNKFWSKNNRVINLLEVQYGNNEVYHFDGVPISSCISSRLSSGGATYTQSYQVGQSLTLDLEPTLSLKLMEIGATLSFGTNDLILSLTNTGSIACIANPGKRTQVFGSFDYIHFPNARKRKVSYSVGNSDFDVGTWISIITSKPNFKEYGAYFYDLSKIPNFYCVDDEELLSCND